MKKITAITACILLLAFYSCQKSSLSGGSPSTSTTNFRSVLVSGQINATVAMGSANALVSKDPTVTHIVLNTTLNLSGQGNAFVNIANGDTLYTNGSSTFTSSGAINFPYLMCIYNGDSSVSNMSNLTMSDSLVSVINGSGNCNFSGTAKKSIVYANGPGSYNGFNLNSKDCDVYLNGPGKVEVNASGHLRVFINGSGNVYYKGNPTTVTPILINGTGKVIQQ